MEFAELNKIQMSMTEQYDPYENAVAERINRTLKYEYGLNAKIKNTALAKRIINHAVNIYNTRRLHTSLNMLTPAYVHKNANVEYKVYRKDQSNVENLLF